MSYGAFETRGLEILETTNSVIHEPTSIICFGFEPSLIGDRNVVSPKSPGGSENMNKRKTISKIQNENMKTVTRKITQA